VRQNALLEFSRWNFKRAKREWRPAVPVRFTCRLVVVRTKSGKLQVKYGCLGDEHVRILTVHGPEMLLPPPEEMTPEEFALWEFELVNGTGYYYSLADTALDAPLVEAKRTHEDEIPKGSVKTELFWAHNQAGDRGLGVRVTNGWNKPIPNFSLTTECHPGTALPLKVGSVQAWDLGGSESMFHPMRPGIMGTSWPGVTVDYYLDPQAMKMLRSRVAAVSTEGYWIGLRTDGYEFDRIPGEVVGAFVDQEEE
jgi:hypothetical protein